MYIYIKKKNVRQDEIINIKYYILRSLGGYYIRGNGQRFNTGNPFIYIKRKEGKEGGKKRKRKNWCILFFFSFLFFFAGNVWDIYNSMHTLHSHTKFEK